MAILPYTMVIHPYVMTILPYVMTSMATVSPCRYRLLQRRKHPAPIPPAGLWPVLHHRDVSQRAFPGATSGGAYPGTARGPRCDLSAKCKKGRRENFPFRLREPLSHE
eukprot:8102484-Pyramimonas_sp.AAC.1